MSREALEGDLVAMSVAAAALPVRTARHQPQAAPEPLETLRVAGTVVAVVERR
jgi:hypothetical protein